MPTNCANCRNPREGHVHEFDQWFCFPRSRVETNADVVRAASVFTPACPNCCLPATGPGLAFADGTICNEPTHAGATR